MGNSGRIDERVASKYGQKGGASRSDAKRASSRVNAVKARECKRLRRLGLMK